MLPESSVVTRVQNDIGRWETHFRHGDWYHRTNFAIKANELPNGTCHSVGGPIFAGRANQTRIVEDLHRRGILSVVLHDALHLLFAHSSW